MKVQLETPRVTGAHTGMFAGAGPGRTPVKIGRLEMCSAVRGTGGPLPIGALGQGGRRARAGVMES